MSQMKIQLKLLGREPFIVKVSELFTSTSSNSKLDSKMLSITLM